MNSSLYCPEAPKHNTLPWQLPPLNTRKLTETLVWCSGDCSIHQIPKWTGSAWTDMMDLREMKTTCLASGCWKGQGNNQLGFNRKALDVRAQMIGFLKSEGECVCPPPLSTSRLSSVAQLFASWFRYASLFSLAHLSSKIFIPPWDAHIRGIMVQLRFKAILETSALFFQSAEKVSPDILYIASKPHEKFLFIYFFWNSQYQSLKSRQC